MAETILYALMIMGLRIIDVSLGTIRTITTVHGNKYRAGLIGFFEVTIWVIAISTVMSQLNNFINIFAYSGGFALGTIIGITIEQKLGSGFVSMNIISMNYPDDIANALRESKIGVTMLPGEGASGGVTVLNVLISRKRQKEVIETAEKIDPNVFITVQPSIQQRGGYVQMRK
ncbi:MAG TPA: DUF5698 domain-containing protein [Ignavibacteria bacterium]|nr:DUF5698 domain-containing protein [Ignavibacteria bacterium]